MFRKMLVQKNQGTDEPHSVGRGGTCFCTIPDLLQRELIKLDLNVYGSNMRVFTTNERKKGNFKMFRNINNGFDEDFRQVDYERERERGT